MFIVKREEKVSKTFRIPTDLVRNLETVAQRQNVSLNYLLVQCCDYALKNLYDGSPERGAR